MSVIIHSIIFALIGLGIEVVFTALTNINKNFAKGDKSLKGYSSIWYIPLYGLVAPIFHFYFDFFSQYSWYTRGLIYMLIIYLAEFFWMATLRFLLGHSPSEKEYYASGRSFWGLIRWDFAPAWFVAGLFLESIANFIM